VGKGYGYKKLRKGTLGDLDKETSGKEAPKNGLGPMKPIPLSIQADFRETGLLRQGNEPATSNPGCCPSIVH